MKNLFLMTALCFLTVSISPAPAKSQDSEGIMYKTVAVEIPAGLVEISLRTTVTFGPCEFPFFELVVGHHLIDTREDTELFILKAKGVNEYKAPVFNSVPIEEPFTPEDSIFTCLAIGVARGSSQFVVESASARTLKIIVPNMNRYLLGVRPDSEQDIRVTVDVTPL